MEAKSFVKCECASRTWRSESSLREAEGEKKREGEEEGEGKKKEGEEKSKRASRGKGVSPAMSVIKLERKIDS